MKRTRLNRPNGLEQLYCCKTNSKIALDYTQQVGQASLFTAAIQVAHRMYAYFTIDKEHEVSPKAIYTVGIVSSINHIHNALISYLHKS
jgi:hypothetical protein